MRYHAQSLYGKAFAKACDELRQMLGRPLEESDRESVHERTEQIAAQMKRDKGM